MYPPSWGFVVPQHLDEQFGILAFRLVSSVAGRCHGVLRLVFQRDGLSIFSDRNRFPVLPCCFACNPLPASPRSVVRSRCDNLLATLQLSRNSPCTFLGWDLVAWAIFLVFQSCSWPPLPILGAGITVLFFRTAFWLFRTIGIVFGCCWRSVAFQHLFWFFGHPEVYVIVLLHSASISASLEGLRQQPTPSYLGMVLCSLEHRRCGYFVWAHHMFTVGMSDLRVYFFLAQLCHWCSTAVKIFCLITGPLAKLIYTRLNFCTRRDLSLLLRIRWIHWPSSCKTPLLTWHRHPLRHLVVSTFWALQQLLDFRYFAKCYLFASLNVILKCLAHRCCVLLGIAGVNAMFLILRQSELKVILAESFCLLKLAPALLHSANSGLWSYLSHYSPFLD